MSDQPVAIVTGGASGIGLAIASALMTEAYDVFVFDSELHHVENYNCLLYTSPSPRDGLLSRMPSSA